MDWISQRCIFGPQGSQVELDLKTQRQRKREGQGREREGALGITRPRLSKMRPRKFLIFF